VTTAALELQQGEDGGHGHLPDIANEGSSRGRDRAFRREGLTLLAQAIGHVDQRTDLRHHLLVAERPGEVEISADVQALQA
jgi:hypothetical protein